MALKQQLAASFQRTVAVDVRRCERPNVTPDADTARACEPVCAAVTEIAHITSADDPRLSDYRSLTDVALRRKVEPENGLFIAEGEKVVRRAVAAGYEMRSLLVCRIARRRRRRPAGAALRRGLRRARSGHRIPRPSRGARGDGASPASHAWRRCSAARVG